jgi:hypothetical protein
MVHFLETLDWGCLLPHLMLLQSFQRHMARKSPYEYDAVKPTPPLSSTSHNKRCIKLLNATRNAQETFGVGPCFP